MTFGAGARVLFNDGSGRLVDAGQRYSEDMSYKVALGDLNGDGGLDAFLANWRGSKVLLNAGGDVADTRLLEGVRSGEEVLAL